MVSWLELVYDYGLAILGMDVLLYLPDIWHHLDVAAVDIYLDIVLFILAHVLNITFVIVIFHHHKHSSRSTTFLCLFPHIY